MTVKYATANGTAVAGSDYTAVALTTLTIPAGAISKDVPITIPGDTTNEPDETFLVKLSSPTGATILDGSGTGTIRNDDPEPEIRSGTRRSLRAIRAAGTPPLP